MADNLFSWVPQYFKLTSLFFSINFLQGSIWIKSIHMVFFPIKNEFAVFPFQWLQFLRFFVLEIVSFAFAWTNCFWRTSYFKKNELYGLPINSQRFFKDALTTSKQISSTKTFLRRTYQQNVSMNVSLISKENWAMGFATDDNDFHCFRSLTKFSMGYLWMKMVRVSSR